MKMEHELYTNAYKALVEIFDKCDEDAAVYYFGKLSNDRLVMGAKLANRIFTNTDKKLSKIAKEYLP